MESMEYIKEALENVKSIFEADAVIGTPIVDNQYITVVPLSKMSVGFAGLGGEFEGKSFKNPAELPLGGMGGGANIKPMGFLVVNCDKVRYISVDDNYSESKWEKYVDLVMDILSK